LKFAKAVAKKFNSKAVIYERFRTAMVPIGEYHLEFVGTRKEEYKEDSRKPVVSEGTLDDDLKRRDFTINAMAVSLNKETMGELIDLFGGKRHLKSRELRTPLDPEITFSDDPLRMMRAARFAAQLNFTIDEAAIKAMKKLAPRIAIISQERITDEFLKIINSDNPSVGLELLYNSGILHLIFRELAELAGVEIVETDDKKFGHKDVFFHSVKVLENIVPNTNNTWLRFAALVHDIAKPRSKKFTKTHGWTFHGHEESGARMMKGIFQKLKLPMDKLEYVEKLIRMHQRPMVLVDDGVTDSAVRRLAVKAGDDLEDLFTLVRADITTKNPNLSMKYRRNYEKVFQKVLDVQEKDKLREFQSPIKGDEIMEITGLKPCKAVGLLKENIEEAILDGIIPNEYEAAKDYFMENKRIWMNQIADGNKEFA
ncbi:MAG: CCA tRNA nucleotidyltransferase, partial [Bacteroidota bacterium]